MRAYCSSNLTKSLTLFGVCCFTLSGLFSGFFKTEYFQLDFCVWFKAQWSLLWLWVVIFEMIECLHLSKNFGNLKAVDDLSFVAEQGQVLGFLGPNGAGKSTTMKMITGFLPIDVGQVKVCGIDMESQPLAAKAKIGYLPEGAPSYGEMEVGRFLYFIATMRGIAKSQQQAAVDSVVDRVALGGVYRQRIETLSKGFKRRVGLAQAIIHNPEVLILDEPTDGLDPNQKHQVRALIAEMSKQKTIILSTHILEEVQAVCDRAIVIAEGRLIADNSPMQMEKMSRYYHAVSFVSELDSSLLSEIRGLELVRDVAFNKKLNETTVFPKQGMYIFDEIHSLLKRKGVQFSSIKMEAGRLDEVFRNITQDSIERGIAK